MPPPTKALLAVAVPSTIATETERITDTQCLELLAHTRGRVRVLVNRRVVLHRYAGPFGL